MSQMRTKQRRTASAFVPLSIETFVFYHYSFSPKVLIASMMKVEKPIKLCKSVPKVKLFLQAILIHPKVSGGILETSPIPRKGARRQFIMKKGLN